jgi:hypothetical protein
MKALMVERRIGPLSVNQQRNSQILAQAFMYQEDHSYFLPLFLTKSALPSSMQYA